MWECTECGRCCKKWKISVDKEDIEQLEKLGYKKFFYSSTGHFFIKHRNRKCPFLNKKNECNIQIKHGYDCKPKVCRRFPLDKNDVNTIVCGNFSGLPANKPIIEKRFRYKGRSISPEILILCISKIDPQNCANSWYTILKATENRKDLDKAISNPKKIPCVQRLGFKMQLAAYSYAFYPELILLLLEKDVTLRFPCRKIRINYKNISNIKIDNSEKEKFFDLLKNGHGILNKKNFPEHLLFCLFFLEDFSKQLAYDNKEKNADAVDMLNAFCILNSTLRF